MVHVCATRQATVHARREVVAADTDADAAADAAADDGLFRLIFLPPADGDGDGNGGEAVVIRVRSQEGPSQSQHVQVVRAPERSGRRQREEDEAMVTMTGRCVSAV